MIDYLNLARLLPAARRSAPETDAIRARLEEGRCRPYQQHQLMFLSFPNDEERSRFSDLLESQFNATAYGDVDEAIGDVMDTGDLPNDLPAVVLGWDGVDQLVATLPEPCTDDPLRREGTASPIRLALITDEWSAQYLFTHLSGRWNRHCRGPETVRGESDHLLPGGNLEICGALNARILELAA